MAARAGQSQPVKPSSESVSRRMQLQASRDTAPERKLRSALHGHGLRFRVHVRPLPGVRREADTDERLRDAGWAVVRMWTHEDPTEKSSEIAELVRTRVRG